MRRLLIFMVFLLLFAFPQISFAAGIEAAVGLWKQDPSGDISYKGESLSIENELNYDSKTKVFGRVKINTPLIIPNIYLMATPMKFEADGSKNIPFTFGNKTFAANVPFSSSLQLNHYDVTLFYSLPFVKTATAGKFNVEGGINARIIDFKAEVKQPATGISESKSLTLPVPMIYLGAKLKPVKFVALEAEARVIAYSSNHHYDIIGRIKIKPKGFGPVFIVGGYRYEEVKIDESDVKANLNFNGPFIEAGVEF